MQQGWGTILAMGTVYFLRHGESQANAHGVCAGQLESPLTQQGRHQAAQAAQFAIAQRLKFDAILCSPIGRTSETAKIIASAIGYTKKITYLDDLKERFCGDFQGGPNSAYYATPEAISSREMHVESIQEMKKRAERVKAYVDAHYPEKTVLIVSHSGFGKMLRIVFEQHDSGEYDKTQLLPNATLMRFLQTKN